MDLMETGFGSLLSSGHLGMCLIHVCIKFDSRASRLTNK